MFENLKSISLRYDELGEKLNDPQVLSDQTKWQALSKERAGIEPLATAYAEFLRLETELSQTKELLQSESDEDMKSFLKEEKDELEQALQAKTEEIKILLLPKDPNDGKNVYVEIRAGAGGEEAALFASEIYRMYSRYAERHGWKSELVSVNQTELGGVKEIIFLVRGKDVYSRMKFESGVQRVQRVPVTESTGKIQSSTITVAIMPEAEEVDVEIRPEDVRVDVYRSSGHGGQSVNTTDSAVRVTHLPTGLVVTCQDEKSQLKNRDRAMSVLRSRLLEIEIEKQESKLSSERRQQVGTGDRSEKIRTYNFPQTRVTDHRIKYTTHRLEAVMDGDLDEIIDRLIAYYQALMLSNSNEKNE